MTLPPAVAALLLAVSLAIALAALVRLRRELPGTQLVWPWRWSWLALLGPAVVEGWLAWRGLAAAELAPAALTGDELAAPVRFAAALLTFGPVMALLGARRPHHNAWQFIVVSLWLVLALPAAEAIWLPRGQHFAVAETRAWFLLALVGVACATTLPGRFWPSSSLAAVGQLLLLAPHLPWLRGMSVARLEPLLAVALAVGCFACTLAAPACGWPRASGPPLGYDRLWLDFRDRFGALWAVRVLDRINAAADRQQWPCRLTWFGLVRLDGQPLSALDDLDPAISAAVRQTTINLLRRFVDRAWITARLGETLD